MTGIDIYEAVKKELISSRTATEENIDILMNNLNVVQQGVFFRYLLKRAYPNKVEWSTQEEFIMGAAINSMTKEQQDLLFLFASYAIVMFSD